jgi:hypothetical protein
MLGTLASLTAPERLAGNSEAKLWIGLAAEMMDVDFWQSVETLVERKLGVPEIDGVKDFYLLNHVFMGADHSQ